MRGWSAAGISTLLAATGHHAVAGHAPSWAAVVLSLTLAGFVAVLLAGRRLNGVRMVLLVSVSQLGFHVIFSAHGTGHALVGVDPHSHGHHVSTPAPVVQLNPELSDDATSPMLWAHLLAAVLTYAVLRHAESLWWAVIAAWTARVTAVVLWHPVPTSGTDLKRPTSWWPPVVSTSRGWFLSIHTRRGPPAPGLS